jgi:hypothetical protein
MPDSQCDSPIGCASHTPRIAGRDAECWMSDEKDDFQPLSKEQFARLSTDEKASYLARAKHHLRQQMEALNASIDRRRAHLSSERDWSG